MFFDQAMLITSLVLISITLFTAVIWLRNRVNASAKLIEAQNKQIEKLIQTQKDAEVLIQNLEFEKQELSGIVSHDLRGPFNRVFALIQLLQSSTDNLNQDQKDYLGKMHGAIADGLGMIRNLRDYQKLEAKKLDVTLETINLSSVLGVLARNYKVLAEKKKIQWHLDMPPTLMVLADKYCLNRILENMFSNALKFSSENKSVFIKAYDEGLWIQVDVRDEGPGISAEDQTKLFSKFQTLTAVPTGGETATGLGLAVSNTLAEKIQAKLSCVSETDQGSVFTLKVKKA